MLLNPENLRRVKQINLHGCDNEAWTIQFVGGEFDNYDRFRFFNGDDKMYLTSLSQGHAIVLFLENLMKTIFLKERDEAGLRTYVRKG